MLSLLDTFQNKNFETLEVTTVVLTGMVIKKLPEIHQVVIDWRTNPSVRVIYKIALATLKLYQEHFKWF
jgi:hypothetical protein